MKTRNSMKPLAVAAVPFLAVAFHAYAAGVDITALIRQHSVAVVVTGTVSHASYMPSKAFDGDAMTDSGRWLGAKPFPIAFIDYHIPADWAAGKQIVLSSYTVMRLRTGSSAYLERSPTFFTFSGSNDGGATWTELDSQSGVNWSSSASNVYDIASPASYRSYRFTALASNSNDAYPVGLSELTFTGEVISLGGLLAVVGSPADLGDVLPDYGYVENLASGTSFVCAATSPAWNESTLYACTGHVMEMLSPSGWGSPVTNVSSSFVHTQGENSCRLTWLWEPIGYKLRSTPEGGSETVSFSVEPDANGYHAANVEVALIAHPSAQPPASTFVRWHGDVSPGHEMDNPLAVVMDRPRTITPEFRREWVYTPGSPATINNGDWWLKVTGTTSISITGIATNGVGGLLDLTTPISNGGSVVSISGFSGNTILEELRLPLGLTTINGFKSCTSLTNVIPCLPHTVTTLGYQAFQFCPIENHLVLTNSNPMTYGESCFGATKVKSVLFGKGTTYVGTRMFENAKALGEVAFSDMIAQINYNGFSGCTGLTNITSYLPPSLVTLGNAAFKGAPVALDHLELVGSGPVSLSGEYTLSGSMMKTATIWVDTLTTRCFQDCTNLRQLFLLGEKPAFGWGPFIGLPNYQIRIYVPRSSETWQAFADAGNVSALTEAETAQFHLDYPGERLPVGTWVPPNSARQWYCTWTPPNDRLRTTVLLLR